MIGYYETANTFNNLQDHTSLCLSQVATSVISNQKYSAKAFRKQCNKFISYSRQTKAIEMLENFVFCKVDKLLLKCKHNIQQLLLADNGYSAIVMRYILKKTFSMAKYQKKDSEENAKTFSEELICFKSPLNNTMRFIFLLLALHLILITSAQKLSVEEKKIIDIVNRNLPQNLQLLEDMVNINSGTLNKKGVEKVGELLGNEFRNIGFSTEWITLPDSLKRAGHMVAYKKGSKGKKLFLIGHLDTVFEPDMPANPYRKLNDSTATGQGVNDMKGGNVIILAALQALNQLGLLKNTSITAYFTGDEESSGKPASVSRADFINRAKQADIALGFEGAQGLHTVATGRRGSSGWQLTVTGRQAHSAGIFNNNYGAIYEAARIINSFREQLSNEKYLTFNPGIFAGGSDVTTDSGKYEVQGKTNIISPYTVVNGDLRFLSEKQKEAARDKMRSIATTNNLAGTKSIISFTDGIPGMEPTPGNTKLVEVLNKVTTDMGIGTTKAGDPGARGAGDISYVAEFVDCIDGLGASGNGAHAPGETINLKQFPILIQRAAIYIYRLTR